MSLCMAILSPDPNELIEVVSAQDGGVPEKVKLRQVWMGDLVR